MLTDTGRTAEDPSIYNRPSTQGCVDTRACSECGAIVRDNICLCMGCFTCPRCGYKQPPIIAQSFLGPRFYIDIAQIYEGLGIDTSLPFTEKMIMVGTNGFSSGDGI